MRSIREIDNKEEERDRFSIGKMTFGKFRFRGEQITETRTLIGIEKSQGKSSTSLKPQDESRLWDAIGPSLSAGNTPGHQEKRSTLQEYYLRNFRHYRDIPTKMRAGLHVFRYTEKP